VYRGCHSGCPSRSRHCDSSGVHSPELINRTKRASVAVAVAAHHTPGLVGVARSSGTASPRPPRAGGHTPADFRCQGDRHWHSESQCLARACTGSGTGRLAGCRPGAPASLSLGAPAAGRDQVTWGPAPGPATAASKPASEAGPLPQAEGGGLPPGWHYAGIRGIRPGPGA
jgi:hypothetical protein